MATSSRQASLVHAREGWDLIIPLNPVPASRPRVTRWGTYFLKTYARWKEAAEAMTTGLATGCTTDEPLYVSVECVATRPRTGKLSSPNGDVDNFAKAALDAVTKGKCIWDDDKQIEVLIANKRYAVLGEEPYTRVRVGTTWGVLWLMEHLLDDSVDVYDRCQKCPLSTLDKERVV